MAKYLFKPPFLVKKGYTEQAEIITREYRKRAELLHLQLIRKGRGGRGSEPSLYWGSASKPWNGGNTMLGTTYISGLSPTDELKISDTFSIISNNEANATSYTTEAIPANTKINIAGYKGSGGTSVGFAYAASAYGDGVKSSEADYTTLNGYKIYQGDRYDIKSGSKAPYDYDSSWNLGLNQLFVGQDPYAWYQGDPGDGIYHDDCDIKTLTNDKLQISAEVFYKLLDPDYELELPFKVAEGYEITKICEIRYLRTLPVITKILSSGEYIQGYKENAQKYKSYQVEYKSQYFRVLSGFLNTMEYFEFAPVKPRVARVTDSGGEHSHSSYQFQGVFFTNNLSLRRYCCFYANGELENHPLNLKVFVDEWNDFHELYVYEDEEWWVDFVAPVMVFAGLAISIFSFGSATAAFGALGAAASGSTAAISAGVSLAAGVGGVLGGAGLALSGIGMSEGSSSLMNIGKILGFVGSIVTLGASVVNLARTAVSSAANSAKSVISSAGNASQNGLNQTSSLYLSNGSMNASGNGSSTSFGELLKTGDSMSFGEAINTNVALGASTSDSVFSSAISVIKSTIKSYSSAKDAFKNANDFDDDEMPVGSDKSEEREVLYRYDNRLRISGKYASEDNTDLGLMEGSLAYLKSELQKPDIEPNSVFSEQETKVLPIKKQVDYFAQIKKNTTKKRKAKNKIS